LFFCFSFTCFPYLVLATFVILSYGCRAEGTELTRNLLLSREML